jgi:hypothetical protein
MTPTSLPASLPMVEVELTGDGFVAGDWAEDQQATTLAAAAANIRRFFISHPATIPIESLRPGDIHV